jgi:PPOX class probable F420-dependent enzyme
MKEPAINGRPPQAEELAFIRGARVGRLATVDARGAPSVVPFCFALIGSGQPVVVSVLDEKPKRVPDAKLARVRNIERNPQVAFVVDRYDEDWSELAFVQLRGRARLLPPGDEGHAAAVAALREKYPQYRSMAIEDRMVIVIEELRATSWRGDGGSFA